MENDLHRSAFEIPIAQLSPEALLGIIENFILREGTDYGFHEMAMETKIGQIRRQLDRGEIKIVFDPKIESVTLVLSSEWRRVELAEG